MGDRVRQCHLEERPQITQCCLEDPGEILNLHNHENLVLDHPEPHANFVHPEFLVHTHFELFISAIFNFVFKLE